MKSIKEFINKTTNEGLIRKQANVGLKDKIEKWIKDNCNLFRATFEIDDQMKINVQGGQITVKWNKPELPDYIQFGKIEKTFAIGQSPTLKSLRGICESCDELVLWGLGITEFDYMPENVSVINCRECHSLESLKGLPTVIDNIYIKNCDKLADLTGAPQKVGRHFRCEFCPGITSLKGAPQECKEFFCCGCPNLKSLEGCPQKIETLNCSYCPELTSLEGCPKVLKKIECTGCNFPFLRPVKEIIEELYGIKVNSVTR